MITTWYLQSHRTWDRSRHSCIGSPSSPWGPSRRASLCRLTIRGTPDRSKLFGSHGQRPWLHDVVIPPGLISAMERHGHLALDPDVRQLLLTASPATIDRMLAPIRGTAGHRRKRKSTSKSSRSIPIRTFADWNEPEPGLLEVDFVAHGGDSMQGTFLWSLVATDVCSGWTEAVPLVAREQSLVVEGLDVIRRQFPVPVRGIDSDNDSAFINETLQGYCERQKIEFTRSRPYRKNDQAWIEQKNGSVVRRFVGYRRFSGLTAGQ